MAEGGGVIRIEPTSDGALQRPEPTGCGVVAATSPIQPSERPGWMRAKAVAPDVYEGMKGTLSGLHTVCESAHCPNLGECWKRGTATFMILGDVCTRSCRFCAIKTGRPEAVDLDEPRRLGEAARQMNLRHVVITMVARDELDDGGAEQVGACVQAVYDRVPSCSVEVLTSDFKGRWESIETVLAAGPKIFNHNLETVERLTRQVRVQARYGRSLDVLRMAFEINPEIPTKSGIMLGLGEEIEEVVETLEDMRRVGVSVVTLGQYLRPTQQHLPVQRWVTPEEFAWLKIEAQKMGFCHIESGPLVRSSYHAEESVDQPLVV
ncbi:MAG: lipoyl synthase [Armatimonadota bacterium]